MIVCYRCGQLLLAKDSQKTRRCPYCDARLVLEKAKKRARVETAKKASSFIQALKSKQDPRHTQKI
ncbi:MAG: DUF1922 domain-containing protein [Candidatus Bathyarchaeota archaeon]|nr:MAG: DUF1922 domain-containing protein [Candidatus Bathyarchaeota archaeon]